MIIVRSPLRITLGGGGTDLPSYYLQRGGFCVSAAIDKYVYITLHDNFTDELIVKYSKLERVAGAPDIQHPIIRECFALLKMDGRGLEINSMADIPAGTGLGSSSAFTCALLKALHAHRHDIVSPQRIAEEACEVELDRLGEPIGRQDQYISALGGITALRFSHTGIISWWTLPLSEDTRDALADNLLLFFTGYSRSASTILRDQDTRTKDGDSAMLDNLDFTKQLGLDSNHALVAGDMDAFGHLMHRHWEHKQQRSPGMGNDYIANAYAAAVAPSGGALGGKLIGAGGGGFLLFYARDRAALRHTMREMGLREVRYRFDHEGARLV